MKGAARYGFVLLLLRLPFTACGGSRAAGRSTDFPEVSCSGEGPETFLDGASSYERDIAARVPEFSGFYSDGDTTVVLSTRQLTTSEMQAVFGGDVPAARNEVVKRSLRELWVLRSALNILLGEPDVNGIGIPHRENQVELGVVDAVTAEALREHLSMSGCPMDAVSIVIMRFPWSP